MAKADRARPRAAPAKAVTGPKERAQHRKGAHGALAGAAKPDVPVATSKMISLRALDSWVQCGMAAIPSAATSTASDDILEEQDDVSNASTPSPHGMRKRFERSAIYDAPAPKLPPVMAKLYNTPKEVQDNFCHSFQSIMPRKASTASARMHGFSGGGVSKPTATAPLRSGTIPGRNLRVWPTYTSPLLPSLAKNCSSRNGPSWDQGTASRPRANLEAQAHAGSLWRESQRDFALAGQLQMLASSLLRISAKPSLAGRFLQHDLPAIPLPEEGESESDNEVPPPPSRRTRCRRLARSYKKPHGGGKRAAKDK
ncbi:unnamed protein product, partial [Polarella glacialis]